MSTPVIGAPPLAAEADKEHVLRIGDVAQKTGLTQRTIRYYEELGLLQPAARTQGDFRLYGQADVARLGRITRLRDLFGFSLAEIRQVLDAEATIDQLRTEYHATEDTGVKIAKLDEAMKLTEAQLAMLDYKVQQMLELKEELRARMERYVGKRQELLSATGDAAAQDEAES